MSKKKILIALYYYLPYISWISIYAKNLAERLSDKWYEVSVICSQHAKNLPKKEVINWIKIIRLPILFSLWKGVIMPFYWIYVAWISKNYDIINFHFPNADLWLSSLFIPKKKLFITYQCDIFLWNNFIQKIIQKVSFILMKIWLYKSNKIIWLSHDYFVHCKFKNFIDKFIEISPPIRYEELDSLNEENISNTTFHENKLKIWFVWRIVFEKWIDVLIKAIKYVKNNNLHVYIIWDFEKVAWWSVYREIEPIYLQYKNKITFTWFLNDNQLKYFYKNIDVLVLPSIDPLEAFWMVQAEAMYFNVPVIASDMPWVREVIRKTNYWLLTKKGDPFDLAKNIDDFYNNIEKWKILRNNNVGNLQILKSFNVNDSINKYINIFNKN